MIKSAINHFTEFHKGLVNGVVHILGFVGVLYSLYKLNWILFAVSVVILECGHVYNHIAGIKEYDFRPKIIFWRIIAFIALSIVFFWISHHVF